MLGVLGDAHIATLKGFLAKVPHDKIREVCIDMNDGLRKAMEAVFHSAKVVVDLFHFHDGDIFSKQLDGDKIIEH